MDFNTRVAVTRLLKANLQLAQIVSLLSEKLEKQEDKDKVKEHFETFFKALDEAVEALESGRPK